MDEQVKMLEVQVWWSGLDWKERVFHNYTESLGSGGVEIPESAKMILLQAGFV